MTKTLTPAKGAKRAAGKYIVWAEMVQSPKIDMSGHVTRYDYEEFFRYGKVAKKQGELLVTEAWDRVRQDRAFFVDALDWPRYEWGATKRLSRAELNELTK